MAPAALVALLDKVNINLSLDVNKSADQLATAIQKFGSNIVVINMDKTTHSFYCYNDMDIVHWVPSSQPAAGPGTVAMCHKHGWGPTIKVYVDNENPQWVVTAGTAWVYTGKGMVPLGKITDLINLIKK